MEVNYVPQGKGVKERRQRELEILFYVIVKDLLLTAKISHFGPLCLDRTFRGQYETILLVISK